MRPLALQPAIVYGPVRSRRLGISLGVNALPEGQKICNFSCAYCQYGWTPAPHRATSAKDWPDPAVVAAAVDAALACEPRIDRITLAGNGEPTLHPRFGEIVERLRDVRARRMPAARLAVLSNAATLTDPLVAAALVRLDECHMKLDAGDAATLRVLNGVNVDVDAITAALAQLGGVTLQTMFVRDPQGRVDNTSEESVSAWLAAMRRIRPMGAHLYSLDRTPALERLEPVPPAVLARIAARVEALGIPAQVF
jgi:wyosine [tRNA(Phe)-imidazoG37] synthetase (radical SAM superfamily)